MAKQTTTDALEIIDALYIKGRPEMEALLAEAREQLRVAEQLRDLREREGLTQQEVADRAGTSRSVIARLEQPGYDQHTLSTLRKVADAMGQDVKVVFVPKEVAASAPRRAARRSSTRVLGHSTVGSATASFRPRARKATVRRKPAKKKT